MVTVEPLKVTWDVSVTAIVETVVVPLLTIKLPVPAMTASLKVNTKLAPIETPLAPSDGETPISRGGAVSALPPPPKPTGFKVAAY